MTEVQVNSTEVVALEMPAKLKRPDELMAKKASVSTGPFIRIKDDPKNIHQLLIELDLNATVEKENEGIFRNTYKVRVADPRNVPRLIRHLTKNYFRRDAQWQPR